MESSGLLALLAFFTLLIGMAVLAYQVWLVKDAKKAGSHFDSSRDRQT